MADTIVQSASSCKSVSACIGIFILFSPYIDRMKVILWTEVEIIVLLSDAPDDKEIIFFHRSNFVAPIRFLRMIDLGCKHVRL